MLYQKNILCILFKLLLMHIIFYAFENAEALNCKAFSREEAKFVVENFHQIKLTGDKKDDKILKNQSASDEHNYPLKKEPSSKIVANFVKSLRKRISRHQNKAIEPSRIENNGRKMVTMATDLCNRLPNGLSAGYIHCVQFLLYHHLQKLASRLELKWGVNFGNENSGTIDEHGNRTVLEIYTEKKMLALGKVVKIYGKNLEDLTEINEKIRQKFEFCLIIVDETQLKCNAISTGNAQLFVEYFHRIVFEPDYEPNRAKKAELVAINIFNSLRGEWRKDQESVVEEENDERAKILANNWKLAEPSMRVRMQVLVNEAEQKCRKLKKNPFRNFKKIGRSISRRIEKARSLKSEEEIFKKNDQKEQIEPAEETENALDEISSDFVTCIYHFMYAFAQKLITKIEEQNVNVNKNLKGIYEKLRKKTRIRLELAFYFDGVNEMDKWLNGVTGRASASLAKGGEEAENDSENDDDEVKDPFKDCATVTGGQIVDDSVLTRDGGLFDKSFDEHLFPCASQFFEAVAANHFDYHLFVNDYTTQLDTTMEFPLLMKEEDTTPTNGQQNAKDKCFMMRELLISLNKNLAHRLNFEKITAREEKEHLISLYQKYENLRLEKLDNNWMHRMGLKLSQTYQNFVRIFRKWKAKGTLTHPIRDEYRKAQEGMGQTMATLQRSNSVGQAFGKLRRTFSKRRLKRTKSQKTLKELLDEMRHNDKQTKVQQQQDELYQEDQHFENTTVLSVQKTLGELFDEENFETTEIVIKEIGQKMKEVQAKIGQNPLGKRLKMYKLFYRAFYIALAVELFERIETQSTTNWRFVLRANESEEWKLSEKDKQNVALIKEQRQMHIFDEIVNKMGKNMPKGSSIKWKFWNKKSYQSSTEVNGKDKGGIGFELRHLGYTAESKGEELLETLQDEMKLNLDQFNMSFDGQCDLTSDLNDCFVASDGIDFDAQFEKVSLFGKDSKSDQMGALERSAESLFKKLNRWSYKFGQKEKRRKNLLIRFFENKVKAILGVIPKMMTDQMSPFELVVPFYLPMKKSVKFTYKKILVKPTEWLRAWVVNLFATTDYFMKDGKDEMKSQKAKKGKDLTVESIKLSEIEPSINLPTNIDQSEILGESLNPIIKEISKMAQTTEAEQSTKTKKKKKFSTNVLKMFKKAAKLIKDLFVNFALKNAQKETEKSVGEGQSDGRDNAGKNVNRRKRKRRGIETGAGITAYFQAGSQGSSTAGALLIDAKVVDWSLTAPMPGLHFHWLHFKHGIMLGKLNLATSLSTGILVIFIIVGLLYWWHALKLAVYLSILYGDNIGWVIIFLAAIFYIIFCIGFVML